MSNKNSPKGATATVDPLDSLANNRLLKPVAAAALPAVPAGFKATPASERRARLRLVPATQRAELLAALREVYGRREHIKKDLGEFAPEVGHASALAGRIEEVGATLQGVEALGDCHAELEDIALSDGIMLLEKLNEEYQHRKSKMAGLAAKYPHLETLFAQRGSMISDGIARKKAQDKKKGPGDPPTD